MSNSAKVRKLQYLLISQLLKTGNVSLLLPDGMSLEIGITQQDEGGHQVKADDYCYVVTKRGDRVTIVDSYNLGLQYGEEEDTIVYEDDILDDDGYTVHRLDIV